MAVETLGANKGFDAFQEARLKLGGAALRDAEEKLAGRREIEPSSLPSNVKDLREIVHGLAERKRMATEAQIHDETTLDVALSEGVPPGNDSLLTAPGLPTEVESGATRRTFPGFGGLIRWPGNPFAGRGSNPKPDGVTAGSLPAASHSPPPMPPPALPPPPHATPPTMSASASLQATISTGGLPTGGSQRPRSRQSMTSHASAVDMDLDIPDLDTQYAIEVSYGEPQRPMAVTEERHKISLKRTFFEMDLGAAERQQIFEEMGITEERLEALLSSSLDSGEIGALARQGLQEMQSHFVAMAPMFPTLPRKLGMLIMFVHVSSNGRSADSFQEALLKLVYKPPTTHLSLKKNQNAASYLHP